MPTLPALPPGVVYHPNLITEPAALCGALWDSLAWTQAAGNRREYYANDLGGASYTYGTGVGRRTYMPAPYTDAILSIKRDVEDFTSTIYEALVLNGYADQRDSLGWHADDSPEVDPARPIAVVSLGAEREIMFRPIDESRRDEITRVRLQSGSMLLMPAGMQQVYLHRIPKSDRVCGVRVSLTFRGYVWPGQP